MQVTVHFAFGHSYADDVGVSVACAGHGHLFAVMLGCGAVRGISVNSVCRLLFPSCVVAVQLGWVGQMLGLRGTSCVL